MARLENPPENPCFGCGPRHARGLRLEFEATVAPDGSRELRTTFSPQADEIGWPGLLHSGLHFTILYEISYWTALTFGGHLMVSTGPATYESSRLPRVGRPYRARARLDHRVDGAVVVRATTETSEGKPCGSLESTWRSVHRAEIEKSGLELPAYLLAELEP
ncbi:MAG: hypothetical protein ACLPZM_02510 [Thermoplasmata archaeon]